MGGQPPTRNSTAVECGGRVVVEEEDPGLPQRCRRRSRVEPTKAHVSWSSSSIVVQGCPSWTM
jgi:hypothetical protein